VRNLLQVLPLIILKKHTNEKKEYNQIKGKDMAMLVFNPYIMGCYEMLFSVFSAVNEYGFLHVLS
jgi:hypothetical protein